MKISMIGMRLLYWITILATVTLYLNIGCAICADQSKLDSLYMEAEFDSIVSELSAGPWDSLAQDQKLLLLESSARCGNGHAASELIEGLMKSAAASHTMDATAAAVALSIGRFQLADSLADCALIIDPGDLKARLSKAMLLLYFGRLAPARELVLEILRTDPTLAGRFLIFQIAHEAFYASNDWQALSNLCGLMAGRYARDGNLPAVGNAVRDSGMYSEIRGEGSFVVESADDAIEVPLVDAFPRSWQKCAVLNLGGSSYRVLIDTGNEAGWIVCHPDLRRSLVSRRGANLPVGSGSVGRSLTGYRVVTDSLSIGGVVIRDLTGISFQKPDSEFYDANLNPFFIRDRVVTIDYVENKLVLRTKERFESDMEAKSSGELVRTPCYGYKSPFVPVVINDSLPAVALIETGAEDISLRDDFVSHHNFLPKLGGSAASSRNATLPLSIKVGGMLFERSSVPVRPARFSDELTGLSYDLMIGSRAFDGGYSVSFNPFDRTFILQRFHSGDNR